MEAWESLTERQREVMDALIEHGSNKAIGQWLGQSDRSVENTLFRVAKKVGTSDRVRLAVTYDRWRRAQEVAA